MKSSVFMVLLIAALAAPASAGPCPITPSTNIAIYGQTGAGGVEARSRSWMRHFFDWWKEQDPRVDYVFLTAANVSSDCRLVDHPALRLYVQPGGNAYFQQLALGRAGKRNIQELLGSGGAYLGICAGWYYASSGYYWQGQYYGWSGLLGAYPKVEGSIRAIADYDVIPGYALTTVSGGYRMVYYGGPTRGMADTPYEHPGTALLTFSGIPGGLPAAVRNGNMLLVSVHPEAYENDGITGLTTAQRIENYKWLANAINATAGTSFNVP